MRNEIKKMIVLYSITCVVVPLCVLVGADVATGWALRYFLPHTRDLLATYRAEITDESDPEGALRVGHPFALFVRNYKYAPIAKPYHVNSLGYTDDEFDFKKAPDEFRIIALGGSTTVGYDAWPNQLERYLNTHAKGRKFSVYNMGIESYTSMQSVITLAMHGVDYHPDLVIVHDGYNDAIPAATKGFRNDYAHAYKSWHIDNIKQYPWLLVRLIRRSNIAALAAFYTVEGGNLREAQSGEYVSGIEHVSPEEAAKPGFYDRPIYVFTRNLNSVRVLAREAGAKMMILTGPHKNDGGKDYDIYNHAMRTFQQQHPEVWMCDLQQQGAALEPYYVDAIHVNVGGQKEKARLIGHAVLSALEKKR